MNMNRWDVVRVKSKDKYGVVLIPSQFIDIMGHKSFNNIMLEDDTLFMATDDDLEIVQTEVEE